jgi:hypothetical protein
VCEGCGGAGGVRCFACDGMGVMASTDDEANLSPAQQRKVCACKAPHFLARCLASGEGLHREGRKSCTIGEEDHGRKIEPSHFVV